MDCARSRAEEKDRTVPGEPQPQGGDVGKGQGARVAEKGAAARTARQVLGRLDHASRAPAVPMDWVIDIAKMPTTVGRNGEIKMFNDSGAVFAHMWSAGTRMWDKVGGVMGSQQSSRQGSTISSSIWIWEHPSAQISCPSIGARNRWLLQSPSAHASRSTKATPSKSGSSLSRTPVRMAHQEAC